MWSLRQGFKPSCRGINPSLLIARDHLEWLSWALGACMSLTRFGAGPSTVTLSEGPGGILWTMGGVITGRWATESKPWLPIDQWLGEGWAACHGASRSAIVKECASG